MNNLVLSRIQGCLVGGLIGDALGMPWETMTQAEILAATNGKGVRGFHDPVQTRLSGLRAHRAGDVTDDTQLTFAVARSLIRCRGFDLMDIAREHVVEFGRSTAGWGGTTKTGVREIRAWFTSRGQTGRDPKTPPPLKELGEGCGNGVAMKVAPLMIFFMASEWGDPEIGEKAAIVLRHEIMKFGALTHPDPRASYAAFIHAYALGSLLYNTGREPLDRYGIRMFWELIVTLCGMHETVLYPEEVFSHGTLKRRLEIILNPSDPPHAMPVPSAVGTSCFALDSVPFSLGVFASHPTDFRMGALAAVNAGGDTDSNAAMVGQLIGANCGINALPREWLTVNPNAVLTAMELGEQLYRTALEVKES